MSRSYYSVLALCGCACLALSSPALGVVVTQSVFDLSGQSTLDGSVDTLGLSINDTFVIGTPGSIGSGAVPPLEHVLWHVSKFDLTGFGGVTSTNVSSATLIFPDQNAVRNGAPADYDLVAEHFISQSPTNIVGNDGTVAALTSVGTLIPIGGTGSACPTCTASLDVTAQVIADLVAGRTLSAYRIGHDPLNLAPFMPPGGHNYQIDDSSGNGGAFDSGNPVRLSIDFGAGNPGDWVVDGSGDWNVAGNWGGLSLPNSADAPANFGSAITSGPRTVFTDAAVTAGSITFDNANSYVVAGGGGVTLDVTTGNAGINVVQGDHEFQSVVNLSDETDVATAASSSISFNNALNLNGNNLNTSGAGTVNINNQLNAGGGQVNVPAGVLGGSGEVGGNLNVTGGTVAPGNSAGTLSVEGNATFDNSSTLDIEIESLSEFDVLAVTGNAVLDGTLNISLLGGYTPNGGDMFTILTGSSVTDNGLTLTGAGGFSLANSGTALTLTFGGVTLLLGDADNSGTVTADDLIAVQQNFGNVGPNGDGTDLGDANDDGSVTADDLISVQQNFGNTLGASSAAVPEPATVVLMSLLAVATLRRRTA